MDLKGLALCSRYSYPPNSLSLCGPDKQKDLAWYAMTQKSDPGTAEILSQFSTLFPYLSLIAYENNIRDPFDKRVVEAYWLGNSLLHHIPVRSFVHHLSDTLLLRKKLQRKELELLLIKLSRRALPYHAFHVLTVYKRTGHLDIPHTVETMDACLINWGQVTHAGTGSITVRTKPLRLIRDKLLLDTPIIRTLMMQGVKDTLAPQLSIGDWISYHWGYFCQKLTRRQLKNLITYTRLSLSLANTNS